MAERALLHKFNIRDISIKCGHCESYQTLTGFEPGDGFNTYRFECDNDACDPKVTRTLLEIPVVLDIFSQKHPDCGGTGD